MAPEREIFVRAGGAVRYLRVTTRAQLVGAGLACLFVLLCLAVSGSALWRAWALDDAAAAMSAQKAAVRSEAARLDADKRSVESVAKGLEARQDALDALMRAHFGDEAAAGARAGAARGDKVSEAADPRAVADRLAQVRQRQEGFARRLTVLATARLARVESALRDVGLNPRQFATRGQGGPFIPVAARADFAAPADFGALTSLLDRLSAMEAALSVLPSARPTTAPMESSSYGYRRDPFNGQLAFHAGIDFPGRYGQPILAASDGRVIFAGPRAGYGNCLEIDHGHGIVTRYAHLAGFAARTGDVVTRGAQVGRMGSTGRSTGTHLHFEVRVRGDAVDPRPFLEARFAKGGRDVLKDRQIIIGDATRSGNRG